MALSIECKQEKVNDESGQESRDFLKSCHEIEFPPKSLGSHGRVLDKGVALRYLFN